MALDPDLSRSESLSSEPIFTGLQASHASHPIHHSLFPLAIYLSPSRNLILSYSSPMFATTITFSGVTTDHHHITGILTMFGGAKPSEYDDIVS